MDKMLLSVIIISVALIASSAFLGTAIFKSASLISQTINSKELALNKETIQALGASSRQAPLQPEMPPKPGEKVVQGVEAGNNEIMGNPRAKVLFVEFSDFECPFCRKFHTETFPQIKKDYIDTGKVKFAYRDFPLGFHVKAKAAAVAADCSRAEGKYWQMFELLNSSGDLSEERLKEYAAKIGLNVNNFNNCLISEKAKQAVEQDMQAGIKYGVRGTPAFFINGRQIQGALSYEVFKNIIEEELKK